MQFHFSRDPQRSERELEILMRPNRSAANAMGLELKDLFDERARNLSRYLAWEEMYMVLWTRPSALTKSDLSREKAAAKERSWVIAGDAQYPMAAIDSLRSRHGTFVGAIKSSLEDLGIQAQLVDVYAALRAVRNSLYPNLANDKWRACLPGDPLPPRLTRSTKDFSDILWPPLRRQLCLGDAETLSSTVVAIGDIAWSGVDMTLAPQDPTPFPQLLARLAEAEVPFRMSFLIESGGIEAAATRKMIAAILGFSNDVNKQIKRSLEALEELSRNASVVKLRISLATWRRAIS